MPVFIMEAMFVILGLGAVGAGGVFTVRFARTVISQGGIALPAGKAGKQKALEAPARAGNVREMGVQEIDSVDTGSLDFRAHYLDLTQRLHKIDTMLMQFRSTVKNQLRNPYYMDTRSATVRSLYTALDRAKKADPMLNAKDKFNRKREEIQSFAQAMTILEDAIEKAIIESKKYQLSPVELENWKKANELYVKVFESPSSSEYSRQALIADFQEACDHLPFISLDDALDVSSENNSLTV